MFCAGLRYPKHVIVEGISYSADGDKRIPLQVFGEHNPEYAAQSICHALGVERACFYEAIQTFRGANRRLELIKRTASSALYKDFA